MATRVNTLLIRGDVLRLGGAGAYGYGGAFAGDLYGIGGAGAALRLWDSTNDGASKDAALTVEGTGTFRSNLLVGGNLTVQGTVVLEGGSVVEDETFTVNSDDTLDVDVVFRAKAGPAGGVIGSHDLTYKQVGLSAAQGHWLLTDDLVLDAALGEFYGNSAKTQEPAIFWQNDGGYAAGALVYDGAAAGVAAAGVNRVGRALDLVTPAFRGPVTISNTAAILGKPVPGHDAGADQNKYFVIDPVDANDPHGYNVARRADGTYLARVLKDGLELKPGPAADPGADYEIIRNDGSTASEAGSTNVLHLYEAITPVMNVWLEYHRKSRAQA